ncbi:hypothetical protein [Desulfovibrio inopinatus]|uniref:hypothetical protein n=1 Tax=Desulfovibrio inopinatus TaxID=102109 RepID=UPI0004869FCB|nr:hypothetical protein [Desulfovibrio inopinatus]
MRTFIRISIIIFISTMTISLAIADPVCPPSTTSSKYYYARATTAQTSTARAVSEPAYVRVLAPIPAVIPIRSVTEAPSPRPVPFIPGSVAPPKRSHKKVAAKKKPASKTTHVSTNDKGLKIPRVTTPPLPKLEKKTSEEPSLSALPFPSISQNDVSATSKGAVTMTPSSSTLETP